MKDEGRAGKDGSLVRRLFCLFLLASCVSGCGGLGNLSTDYTFSSKSARQQSQILRVVDAKAHLLGMTRQIEADHYVDAGFDHTYLNDSLRIDTEFNDDGKPLISLYKTGRHKSPEFVRAENMLTPALRHIDPHLTIKTEYIPNPMM